MALALKKKCFPITRESGRDYINVAAILNRENTGIMQKLRPVEDSIFAASERNLDLWRKNGFDQKAVRDFYHWLDGTVRETYKREFGIVN
jgi:hypothetical protein